MKTPLLGGSYVGRSPNIADNRMVNLYPEALVEGGLDAAFLQRCPGLRKVATAGNGPISSLWVAAGRLFASSGAQLYEILPDWSAVLRGSFLVEPETVSVADNGKQIFYALGAFGYIFTLATNELKAITDPVFSGAGTVTFIDGYFIFNQPDTQVMWSTAINDGFDIGALDFASAEASPDNIVAVFSDHNELWVFGTNTIEVWYDAGLDFFPFQRIQGAFTEIGCIAPQSVAKLDNSLFWLGADTRGRGVVYRTRGYTGQRVSTHAVEWQLQNMPDLSKAIGFSYQQDGHLFYVLTVPGDDKTWCFDVTTSMWHERAALLPNGLFDRYRANCQAVFNNRVLVGDYRNGDIYYLSIGESSSAGLASQWCRSWRALAPGENNLSRTFHHALQLMCNSGNGAVVSLRWSDDGGNTWSNYHTISMGVRNGPGGSAEGYGKRVIWRRLGATQKLRDRVYEVSGSDEFNVQLLGAEILLSG